MDDLELIASREIGPIPVSIGTALGFESVLTNGVVDRYSGVLINLRTMMRNFYASFKSGDVNRVSSAGAANAVIEELTLIAGLFKKARPIVYVSDYSDLERVFPGCKRAVHNGEKRIILNALEDQAVEYFLNAGVLRVEHFKNCALSFDLKGSALLFSHVVPDLFCRYDFTKLDLLESYSGVVKERSSWYTKLTDGKDLKTIPFNRFTLMMFGDKNVYFGTQPLRLRRALVELSIERGWTTITSMDVIKSDISRITDREVRDTLKVLARPYL